MIPTFLLLSVSVAYPVPVIPFGISKADLSMEVTFKELDAAQVTGLLGDAVPSAFRDKFRGKIGKVVLTIHAETMTVKATGFRMPGDWLSRVEGTMDLKTRAYTAKLYAFGGLMEVSGTVPTDEQIGRVLDKGAKGTTVAAKATGR